MKETRTTQIARIFLALFVTFVHLPAPAAPREPGWCGTGVPQGQAGRAARAGVPPS